MFELDRLELTGGDRWELEGRWFGVRGRRFMRPALSVVVDGRPTRLLADLAEKPWAAEDGEPWKATFPFPVKGELLEAELTVAPDITVTLALPAARAVARKPKLSPGAVRPRAGVGRAKQVARGDQLGSPARELAEAEGEQRRLQRRLERAEEEQAQAQARTQQTTARLDELLGQLSEVARERDQVQSARDQLAAELQASRRERKRLEAERDSAGQARDEAMRTAEGATEALERALAERGAAVAAQKRAESERDAAVAERDQTATERGGALALRDHALAERDAALAARDDAVYQRDSLARTSERLQSELADVVSTRGAALVMRRATQERAVSRRNTVIPWAVAVVIALALIVVLVIALRGV